MVDAFLLAVNISMAVYAFIASFIFWFSWKERSDFFFFFIGTVLYSLGHTALIVKHYLSVFSYIGNGLILLALAIVLISSLFDYYKKMVKDLKETVLFWSSIISIFIIGIVVMILFNIFGILNLLNGLVVSMIFLTVPAIGTNIRFYLKHGEITRLFIFFAFTAGLFTSISTILSSYYNWGLALNIAFNFIFQSFIVTTGLSGIAEQKISSSEEKYRLLSEHLEEKVNERTTQLELANKELESFSYSVSHDLRTPLRSISGFANILKKEYGIDLDEKGKDYINRIMDNTDRMNELINDLLDLAHISRTDFILEEINLTNIANEIIENFKQLYPERDIDFIVEEDLIANCDAKLIRIVLENLLGNAVKFTKTKESAKITFETIVEHGDQRVFIISDDGIGFDMAYYEKIFGLFQRLHTSKKFEGTGIGLVTVKRIIERHNGKIWADAKVDEGAAFYFTLS